VAVAYFKVSQHLNSGTGAAVMSSVHSETTDEFFENHTINEQVSREYFCENKLFRE
jgi:hypothetical protein